MRVVVLASGAFAGPSIRWLASSGHEIPLLITQPSRGSGRGRKPTPTPAKLLADELGIPCVECENVNSPDFVERVRDLKPFVMLVIAFGQKLGSEFLSASPGGAINLHASLLPKYRGAAPINWALARGETTTGCTVFRIVSRMDGGPILAQDALEIDPNETAGALHDRLAVLGARSVESALAQFENGRIPDGAAQDDRLATLAPKLKKSDGQIDFSQDAQAILCRIRAMTPWPGATTALKTEREIVPLTIIAAAPTEFACDGLTPGTLDSAFQVATQDYLIEIIEVQPSGGRVMRWRDFLNGRQVRPGDRFVSGIDTT